MPNSTSVTELLEAHRRGEEGSFARAVALVYEELRRLARGQRRRGLGSPTMDTTALVHEAYLKLEASGQVRVSDREHLLAVAARAIRQIAVDYARSQGRQKRGGDQQRVFLEELPGGIEAEVEEILAIDRALHNLGAESPRLAQVFECRYFGGLSIPETASALSISPRTADRDWQSARQRLREQLS